MKFSPAEFLASLASSYSGEQEGEARAQMYNAQQDQLAQEAQQRQDQFQQEMGLRRDELQQQGTLNAMRYAGPEALGPLLASLTRGTFNAAPRGTPNVNPYAPPAAGPGAAPGFAGGITPPPPGSTVGRAPVQGTPGVAPVPALGGAPPAGWWTGGFGALAGPAPGRADIPAGTPAAGAQAPATTVLRPAGTPTAQQPASAGGLPGAPQAQPGNGLLSDADLEQMILNPQPLGTLTLPSGQQVTIRAPADERKLALLEAIQKAHAAGDARAVAQAQMEAYRTQRNEIQRQGAETREEQVAGGLYGRIPALNASLGKAKTPEQVLSIVREMATVAANPLVQKHYGTALSAVPADIDPRPQPRRQQDAAGNWMPVASLGMETPDEAQARALVNAGKYIEDPKAKAKIQLEGYSQLMGIVKSPNWARMNDQQRAGVLSNLEESAGELGLKGLPPSLSTGLGLSAPEKARIDQANQRLKMQEDRNDTLASQFDQNYALRQRRLGQIDRQLNQGAQRIALEKGKSGKGAANPNAEAWRQLKDLTGQAKGLESQTTPTAAVYARLDPAAKADFDGKKKQLQAIYQKMAPLQKKLGVYAQPEEQPAGGSPGALEGQQGQAVPAAPRRVVGVAPRIAPAVREQSIRNLMKGGVSRAQAEAMFTRNMGALAGAAAGAGR